MIVLKNQVFNPYLPLWEYVPDGEPHVFGDRVYVYGSHDKFNGKQYCENDYVCWSASVDDLSDWRYEGVIYQKTQAPNNQKKKPRVMYAPDVTRGPDGRYYLYYSLAFQNDIQVAVCDTPAGKYDFYGIVHHPDVTAYGKKKTDRYAFDPAVLTDDDGRVWLYSGFGGFAFLKNKYRQNQCMELERDMLTVKSVKPLIPCKRTSEGTGFEGHEFFEASSIRKFNGKYYFVYSSMLSHELSYAVSDRPDGDFVYGGTLHSNGNIGIDGNEKPLCYWGNNHGGIEYIRGKYYIFGHRQTNYHEYSRQGVAEELRFEDGKFYPAEMTSCGLNGGPLRDIGVYPAGIACVLMGKEGACKTTMVKDPSRHPCFTQEGEDGESDRCHYVHNITDGTVVGYKYFCFRTAKEISVCVRGSGSGILLVSHEMNGPSIGSIHLSGSADWKSESGKITPLEGKRALYFRYQGTGSFDMKLFELL
ncbi:MAG: family 43 glycosylhydrolase [Faecousia sp.]